MGILSMQNWRPELFAYLGAIWQYRWQGLAAAWVVCVLGWLGVAIIPNTYKSTAQVYIDTHILCCVLCCTASQSPPIPIRKSR